MVQRHNKYKSVRNRKRKIVGRKKRWETFDPSIYIKSKWC
jgi:hypothetical protein